MPVVLRVNGYKFWFYEADLDEPPHVHVGKAGNEAKFWIKPISESKTRGFRQHELNEIVKITREHQNDLLAKWQKERQKRDHGKSKDSST